MSEFYPISYLVLSDIHLGHRTTRAEEILQHLTVFFNDFTDTPLSEVDAIFIAGDLWDTNLQLSSEVVNLFIPFWYRLLSFCANYDIALRVLEGTPSHDRRQGHLLTRLVESSSIPVDFKYIPKLSIEYMTRLKRHVLYVPDECRPTAAAIEKDVETLLLEHNLEKVDLAIMHGMFHYQLGKIKESVHTLHEDFFLDRVRGYINIGHIHTPSTFNRILAQGSFDRLAHGEDHPKGGMLIKCLSEEESMHVFLENKLAKSYKTIQARGSVEDTLKRIEKLIATLPEYSHIRIQTKRDHPILQSFETLSRKYPLYSFTKKVKEIEEESIVDVEIPTYTSIVLNEETLFSAIKEEIDRDTKLDESEVVLLDVVLNSITV